MAQKSRTYIEIPTANLTQQICDLSYVDTTSPDTAPDGVKAGTKIIGLRGLEEAIEADEDAVERRIRQVPAEIRAQVATAARKHKWQLIRVEAKQLAADNTLVELKALASAEDTVSDYSAMATKKEVLRNWFQYRYPAYLPNIGADRTEAYNFLDSFTNQQLRKKALKFEIDVEGFATREDFLQWVLDEFGY